MTAPQTHEQALAVLTAAVGDGNLTLAEFDRRSEAVVAARTAEELDATVRDLPRPSSVPRAPRAGLAASWLTWAAVVALCSVIYVITCVSSGTMLYPWPIWVAGPWGMVLLAHSIAAATTGLGTFSCAAATSRAVRPWEKAAR
jgi:hypothetical protein